MNAKQAIARSISHNEIVTIDIDFRSSVMQCLADVSDGEVKNGDVHEFWGTDDDGNEWRVHARLQGPRGGDARGFDQWSRLHGHT